MKPYVFIVLLSLLSITLLGQNDAESAEKEISPRNTFFVRSTFGLSPTGDNHNKTTKQLDLIVGKRFFNHWALGLSGGYHVNRGEINDAYLEQDFLNVSGYSRFTPSFGHRFRFFADGKAGYSFRSTPNPADIKFEGGQSFQSGLGIIFPTAEKLRLTLSVNQVLQYVEGKDFSPTLIRGSIEAFENKMWYNRTVVKIGLEFG